MEHFKTIEGFLRYEISDRGRVKRLAYTDICMGGIRNHKEKFLKPQLDKDGYLVVGLHKDGKTYMKKIHRLVAEAFIENPNNLPQVNHKDEDKANPVVENLEWCDNSYNQSYGTSGNRKSEKMKEAHINGRYEKSKIPVRCIDTNEVFESASAAVRWLKENGYPKATASNITQVCKHPDKHTTTCNYKWEYIWTH